MADAPDPRQTRTRTNFAGGMNTQDGRYGVDDNEFFLLENIMLGADRKLKSVPGPSPSLFFFPVPHAGDFLILNDTGDFVLQNDTGDRIKLNG